MKKTELVTVNRNRAATYLFLSKAYEKELTEDQIDEIRTKGRLPLGPHDLDDLENTDIKEGFDLLTRYVSAMKGRDLNDVAIELAAEYASIFLGIRQIVPHPSESVYLGAEHLVMQKQRDEVLEMYRAVGLDKISAFTEPEDHIAVELSFMAHLAEKMASALEADMIDDAKRYLGFQKRFLDEHLARWTPQLCADILKAARIDFYRGVAMITRGFVSMDLSTVNYLLEELEGVKRQH